MPVSVPSNPRAYPASAPGFGVDVVEHSPPRLVQAIGSRVWGEDGAEYVDFDNAAGAVLLGHRDPQVIAAVRMARSASERRGPQRYAAEVSERILRLAPGAETCAFGSQVSQTLRAAMTGARLATGRDQVFVCRAEGPAARLGGPSFPFDDLQALAHLMDAYGEETAAVVLAPCGLRGPSPGYLQGVRALCDRIGAVLVFDETLSGFRVHEGGAQGLYGVRADLTVFGESLANGMPLGVLAGRREVVEAALTAEPMQGEIASLAAAKAVLHRLEADPVIATLRIGGAEIHAETARIIDHLELEGALELAGDPAAGRLRFHAAGGMTATAVKSLWMNECHAHRLFTLGAVNMSYAHGEREIAVLLAAFEQAAERLAQTLRQSSSFPRRTAALHG